MNDDWLRVQEEDRRKTDKRMTEVERLCIEHASELRRINRALEAIETSLKDALDALQKFYGGLAVLRGLGVIAIMTAIAALFRFVLAGAS